MIRNIAFTLPSPCIWVCCHMKMQFNLQHRTWRSIRVDGMPLEAHTVRRLHQNAMYRGSDVRLASGVLTRPSIWPRRTIDPGWWSWRVALSHPLRPAHINAQEIKAVLSTFQLRLESCSNVGTRHAHLLDSQVSMGLLCKGRSSSNQLMRILKRVLALILAGHTYAAYVYVATHLNPADPPSKWWTKAGKRRTNHAKD